MTATPAALAEAAHEHLEARCRSLAFALGYDLVPGGSRVSDARHAVSALAHYAQTGDAPGEPPEVRDLLLSLIPLGMLPADLDPDDAAPSGATDVEREVHGVVLAVLGREALREGRPLPSAWLAAVAGVTASAVRHMLGSGEIRRWKAGAAKGDRRAWVHPDDARRWLAGRLDMRGGEWQEAIRATKRRKRPVRGDSGAYSPPVVPGPA